jgi:signal transduction histidine kinase
MTPTEAKYPEDLQSIPLDEQQLQMLKKPATVMHLLDKSAAIPDSHRSYLVGLGVKTLLIIPLVISKQLIGSLTFRFTADREFHPEEIEIARALASQASLAIQLTRLANAARQSAVLAERNQLAGEIHDSLAQFFTGISMQLGAAMSNAVRHAKPTVISVNLRCKPPDIILEVTDNGSGIADSQVASREGLGFSNMRGRAENIGAQLKVRTALGRGTTIVVQVPMNF